MAMMYRIQGAVMRNSIVTTTYTCDQCGTQVQMTTPAMPGDLERPDGWYVLTSHGVAGDYHFSSWDCYEFWAKTHANIVDGIFPVSLYGEPTASEGDSD